MKINVKIPIVCQVDNVGAIFMAENVTATPKSKHIDTRAKFVTQFVDDGFLKIMFVKTAENVVLSDIHEKHKGKYIWTTENLN